MELSSTTPPRFDRRTEEPLTRFTLHGPSLPHCTVQGPLRHLRKAARVLEVLVAVVCLQFVIGPPVYAGLDRWTSNGPTGESGAAVAIAALAINPSTPTTLYAGQWGGGVLKSTDAGGSWTAVNSGLTYLDVRALAINPSTPTTLYAGTGGGGVFKSTDAGGSWTAVGPSNDYVFALAFNPSTPTTLYAGTSGDVFKSTDAGGSRKRMGRN